MEFLTDPAEMPPDSRFREIAALLATGYIRAKSQVISANKSAQNPRNCLDKEAVSSGHPRQGKALP